MGVVWITCPTTGRNVSTGIETDQDTFDAVPGWTPIYKCPGCGAVHDWLDLQAELVNELPPSTH